MRGRPNSVACEECGGELLGRGPNADLHAVLHRGELCICIVIIWVYGMY